MPQSRESTKAFRVLVLYSAGHLGSATILNKLLEMPQYEVVGVVRAKTVEFSWAGIKKIKRHLKIVGWRFAWLLLWQQLVQALTFGLIASIGENRLKLRPTWRIAKQHHIPVFQCKNINSPDAIAFIESLQPDLLVSAYFSQILKKEVISIPALGTLNVHPGWLPAYKGAMAYFWVLKNGEEKAGVTLHWIDEGIDTGEIIARENIEIITGMTQQMVLMKTAEVGASLLNEAGYKLQRGEQLEAISAGKGEQDNYYPMPGSDDFESYFKRRRYFRIRDVIFSIWRK